MKYIITETQLRKFNKENLNQGKYGKDIDRLVLSYLDSGSVCDVITIKSDNNSNLYITLILYNGHSSINLKTKIERFIEEFIPVTSMVMISDLISSKGCQDI